MTLSLLEALRTAPERAALVVGARVLTFAELYERVTRLAAWLEERGATKERALPVAVVADGSVAFFELAHALIALGLPIALLHPRWPPQQGTQALDLVSPALMLEPPIAFQPSHGPTPDLLPVPDDERALAILFTSGSTGEPKAVVLSRRAFVASAEASAARLGFRPDDRWLLSLPTAHIGGFSVLTRCLVGRGAVVLPEPPLSGTTSDPSELLRAASNAQVTLMSLVPTQLHALVERGMRPPSSLRALLLGGAPASSTLVSRAHALGWPVLPSYGLTEACSQVATTRPGARPHSGVGPALAGIGLRIVDGEIQVSGPTLLSGYLERDVGLVPALDREGWFRTGDLGFIDDAGNLVVEGRRSELINTGGEKVFAVRVERCALEHPEVLEACALGIPDDLWGQRVVLVVVPKTRTETDSQPAELESRLRPDLEAWFLDRLANFERPKAYAFKTSLPRLPSGKVDRASLLSWAIARLASS